MEITDAFMKERLGRMAPYPLMFMRKGPHYQPQAERTPEQRALIWEHGRRNMRLQAEGIMPLVGPLNDGGDIVGVCVFNVAPDEARALMDDDPAVKAGVLTYALASWFAAPGDALPA